MLIWIKLLTAFLLNIVFVGALGCYLIEGGRRFDFVSASNVTQVKGFMDVLVAKRKPVRGV